MDPRDFDAAYNQTYLDMFEEPVVDEIQQFGLQITPDQSSTPFDWERQYPSNSLQELSTPLQQNSEPTSGSEHRQQDWAHDANLFQGFPTPAVGLQFQEWPQNNGWNQVEGFAPPSNLPLYPTTEPQPLIPWLIEGGPAPPWGNKDPRNEWFDLTMDVRQEKERLNQKLQVQRILKRTLREKKEDVVAYQAGSAEKIREAIAAHKAEMKEKRRENRKKRREMRAQAADKEKIEEGTRLLQVLNNDMDVIIEEWKLRNAAHQEEGSSGADIAMVNKDDAVTSSSGEMEATGQEGSSNEDSPMDVQSPKEVDVEMENANNDEPSGSSEINGTDFRKISQNTSSMGTAFCSFNTRKPIQYFSSSRQEEPDMGSSNGLYTGNPNGLDILLPNEMIVQMEVEIDSNGEMDASRQEESTDGPDIESQHELDTDRPNESDVQMEKEKIAAPQKTSNELDIEMESKEDDGTSGTCETGGPSMIEEASFVQETIEETDRQGDELEDFDGEDQFDVEMGHEDADGYFGDARLDEIDFAHLQEESSTGADVESPNAQEVEIELKDVDLSSGTGEMDGPPLLFEEAPFDQRMVERVGGEDDELEDSDEEDEAPPQLDVEEPANAPSAFDVAVEKWERAEWPNVTQTPLMEGIGDEWKDLPEDLKDDWTAKCNQLKDYQNQQVVENHIELLGYAEYKRKMKV